MYARLYVRDSCQFGSFWPVNLDLRALLRVGVHQIKKGKNKKKTKQICFEANGFHVGKHIYTLLHILYMFCL